MTNGSNLVTIPSRPYLTDTLVLSPIFHNEGNSAPTIATGGAGMVFADPTKDPELAMDLFISIVENRDRQAAEDIAGTLQEAAITLSIASQPKDEEILARVWLCEIQKKNEETGLTAMTKEEQIEYDMKMSTQTSYDQEENVKDDNMEVDQACQDATTIKTETGSKNENYLNVVNEQTFLQSVIESLPGVDAQSGVRQAIEAITGTAEKNPNIMILRTATNNTMTN